MKLSIFLVFLALLFVGLDVVLNYDPATAMIWIIVLGLLGLAYLTKKHGG